jgi:uncharacterized protein YyaL (SSP411 family)
MQENRLAREKSPYLLQHRHNPVDWFPWGAEAFDKARRERKPVFLSIGYSTCYWCHVMEQDSFERDDVAAVLNRDFVSIKVDREERPDLDQIYMDAVTALSGHGGWPMSVFLTPEGAPFWGGTYFPRAQFLSVLRQIREVWDREPNRIEASAKSLTALLNERGGVEGAGAGAPELDDDVLRRAAAYYHRGFDPEWGGFSAAPKFPPSMQCSLLLRLWLRSGNAAVLDMAVTTLDCMARGGIYDHLGGGFSRYSTDEKWLVPHFEKMLYDNALLAVSYLEAYQATKMPEFALIARETLDYLLREMHHESGGFYSAQDAGEVGREGEFYVWKPGEIATSLAAEEIGALGRVFYLPKEGNFEGKIVLSLKRDAAWAERGAEGVMRAREKLLDIRRKRTPPHLDDKILSGWNGLAISAFALASQVLGEERYLRAAEECAAFLKASLYRDGKLLRRFRDGEAAIGAYLEDYSFVIAGLLVLYESDFNSEWLAWAAALQSVVERDFRDKEGGYFYSTASDLIVRRKDYFDGAVPSGNSVTLGNLLRLGDFYFSADYYERARELLAAMAPMLSSYPHGFPKALEALNYRLSGSKQVAVIGGNNRSAAEEFIRWRGGTLLPPHVFGAALSPKSDAPPLVHGKTAADGKSAVYLCEHFACRAPITDLEEAKRRLADVKPLKL